MRKLWLIGLFLTAASSVFGQLDSDTVTIQASRSVNLTPDQIAFYVSVSAGPNTSLDQIVAALSSTGITAANFSNMYGDNRSSFQWSFTLAVPFTKTTATIASFIALQQSIVKNNSGMSLLFQIQGTQVSESIQAQSCAARDLVADAQAQAQSVAEAAGLAIGPIIAISDGSSATAPAYVANAWFAVGVPSFGFVYSTTPSGCYLEVKFKLLRYVQAAPLSVTPSQSDKLTFP
jgi:hypothetical protein